MAAVMVEYAPAVGAGRIGAGWMPRDVAVAAAGTVSAGLALGLLPLLAVGRTPGGQVAQTAVLLAVCLPIYVRHLVFAVRDRAPSAARLSTALLAVLVLGAAPLLGAAWLDSAHVVAVVVLLTLPPAVAMPLVLGLLAALGPAAVLLGASREEAIWLAVTATMRVIAIYALVWMVLALRRLRGAAAELTEQAIVQERLRIDRAATETVRTALRSIAESSDRAADLLVRGDRDAAHTELVALVTVSRGGLAQARQLIRGFQQPDLLREIESTAALLAAAHIDARLDLPLSGPPEAEQEPLRTELRLLLARLLRQSPSGPVRITLRQADGRWALSCVTDVPGK
ncbi:hypothetical protein ACFVMC_08695 [Nocardia sp. NPDC127579]|uniref:hypothetical protein n=1 Tax=Nocardia sp. NPDC127579 TaxID=3345402 RepID=UPI003642F327